MNVAPQTEIQQKRTAWWAQHYKTGMPLNEVLRLSEKLVGLFPMTDEERRHRAKEMAGVPEFVL